MVADELVAAVRQSAPSTAVLLHTGRADGQALGERLQVKLYAPKTAALEHLERARLVREVRSPQEKPGRAQTRDRRGRSPNGASPQPDERCCGRARWRS